MSLEAYRSYEESGIDYLGRIPTHWRVLRLKRLCDVFPSNVDKKVHVGERQVRLCNYTDVYYNERITSALAFMVASASDEQIERFELRAGDTIITKDSETADDIAVSAFVPDDLPGVVCGYHLAVLRPRRDVEGAFVKRLFDSAFARASVEVRANGLTRVGLPQYAIDNLAFPCPPIREQAAIAAFIDRETAKIDTLVSEQERLIALLREKRQAVISHAVTKGLDPNAPMKPSGIEWLGDVPTHWEARPLWALFGLKHGYAFDSSGFDDSGDFVVMTPGNFLERGGFRDKFPEKFYRGSDFPEEFILKPGDLLVAMTEQAPGLLGSALFVPARGTYLHNQRLGLVQRLRTTKASARYLFHLFNSARFRAELGSYVTGSTVRHTSPTKILSLRIFAPTVAEQDQIARFLDERLVTFDALEATAEEAILLLQERRAALISAAVTGQIHIRGLAAS